VNNTKLLISHYPWQNTCLNIISGIIGILHLHVGGTKKYRELHGTVVMKKWYHSAVVVLWYRPTPTGKGFELLVRFWLGFRLWLLARVKIHICYLDIAWVQWQLGGVIHSFTVNMLMVQFCCHSVAR